MVTATNAKQKKEKLTIYLVKSDRTADGELLKVNNALRPIEINIGPGESKLYIKRDIPRPPPPWTGLFTSLPNISSDLFGTTKSVGAVLVYRTKFATFLLTFGMGFHLIQEESVVRDFGLRVTLNSVEANKLRSLDKGSYSANPLNSRTQSSKGLDIFELAMDSEMEMLYAITGDSKVPIFGAIVTGRDALTIMPPADVYSIYTILQEAFKKYNDKLPPDFEWVENISKVKDTDEIKFLEEKLDTVLVDGDTATCWLGEPEIVDWESQQGYLFEKRSDTRHHVTLNLEDYLNFLDEKGLERSVNCFKLHSIHVSDEHYHPTKSWSAFRCLYAEISHKGSEYILRNGTWYRLKNSFVASIDAFLTSLPKSRIKLPIYTHDNEGDYNASVALPGSGYDLMDRKLIKIGGSYDKVEFCDLIKGANTLIHVKFYRGSSTLSHLFSQGEVAAESFVKDEKFRQSLNKLLPPHCKLLDTKTMPDASKFSIVYAIATDKLLPDQLPFFSKVTLKNAFSNLRAMKFKVELLTIDVDSTVFKKSKHKPVPAKKKRK